MSNEKQESPADIVAEMRSYAQRCREENFGVAPECDTHYNEDDVEYLPDRLEAALKREREGKAIMNDWKSICAKCADGIEPQYCEYYGEPNGCNSPIYGEHPKFAPVGNMAAIREALRGLIDGICFHCDMSGDCKGVPCEKMQEAKAALAAPPRECDRFADEKQADALHAAFIEYCNGCDCPMGCDYRKNPRFLLDTNCASIMKCFARFALSKATQKNCLT